MYNLCCTSSRRNVAKPENRLVSGKSRYICSASVANAAWGKIQSHADSLQGLWEIGQTKISKKRYLRCFACFYGRTPANHLGCIKPCNKINWISIGARFLNHPQSNWMICYSTHQWVGSLLGHDAPPKINGWNLQNDRFQRGICFSRGKTFRRNLDAKFLSTGRNWLVVSTPLKNISQNRNLPQIEVKIKNIWNQHLDNLLDFHQVSRPHKLY